VIYLGRTMVAVIIFHSQSKNVGGNAHSGGLAEKIAARSTSDASTGGSV